MNPTPEQVTQALTRLGDTPEMIADELQGLGIKGTRRLSYGCPLANYLEQSLSSDFPTTIMVKRKEVVILVLAQGIGRGMASTFEVCSPLPPACREFVNGFDCGDYEKLEVKLYDN